jgi:putative endonuclease
MANPNEKKLIGRWGESVAAEYLKKKRYKIIGLNYSRRVGEIDVIATNRKFVVFVEVKLRKSASFALAREFVTPAKQERVRITAELWLQSHPTKLQPRFDVIEIYAPDGMDTKKPEITHLENAF